jgi:hypothetical protein
MLLFIERGGERLRFRLILLRKRANSTSDKQRNYNIGAHSVPPKDKHHLPLYCGTFVICVICGS